MVTYFQAVNTVVIRITVGTKNFKFQILCYIQMIITFVLKVLLVNCAFMCMTRKHTIIGVYMKKLKKK